MSEPSVLFVRPNTVSDATMQRCADANIIVIEIDDPANAKFVRAGTEMSSSAMLGAAMKAMVETKGTTTEAMMRKFAEAIAGAVLRAELKDAQP